ncbi:MAG: multidrug efflux SMR transporter [Brevundimonas sp.]|nr:MAG: multidrug efflux SMR transporter [Brevundimonas sp.]
MHSILLGLAIMAEVAATMALKQSNGFSEPVWILPAVVGYLAAFGCFAVALTSMPTGIAYATWCGVGIILITALAWKIDGQKVNLTGLRGMGLVILGVALMNVVPSGSLQPGADAAPARQGGA